MGSSWALQRRGCGTVKPNVVIGEQEVSTHIQVLLAMVIVVRRRATGLFDFA